MNSKIFHDISDEEKSFKHNHDFIENISNLRHNDDDEEDIVEEELPNIDVKEKILHFHLKHHLWPNQKMVHYVWMT